MDAPADLPLSGPSAAPALPQPAPQPLVPHWDDDRRELTYQGLLVRAYRCRAPRQIAILRAFEEEHWPFAIDDPLPPEPEVVIQRRLHDAIKSLNRHQVHRLLRFRGDGTGERVTWEPVTAAVRASLILQPHLQPEKPLRAGIMDAVQPTPHRPLIDSDVSGQRPDGQSLARVAPIAIDEPRHPPEDAVDLALSDR